jgi:hypothetical protein
VVGDNLNDKKGVGMLVIDSFCARLCRLLLKGRKKEAQVVGRAVVEPL